MGTNSAEGIRWDLSDLFAAHNDPRLEAALNDCLSRAKSFSTLFRGTIHTPSGPAPEHLLSGLKELEEIEESLSRAANYSSLLYAADSLRPEHQDLEQKVEQRVTGVKNHLLFFQLEWMGLDDHVAERLRQHPAIRPYRHYLKISVVFVPTDFPSQRKKLSMRRTTRGETLLGAFFRRLRHH